MKRWGLRTLGELAALPSADLAARLGMQGLVWQAIARGEDGRPLVPDVEEERFESTLELEWPIEGLEPLSFVLTRLLEPLSIRLERRDRGAAVLHVQLRLVSMETLVRSLQLPSPIRDVRTLRTLALLDLESHPPVAAIDRVTVLVDPTPGRIVQQTFFTRAHATPEQLSTLLARLGALMGQDRISAPAEVDSYRPGAFAMRPFATEQYPSIRVGPHPHAPARSSLLPQHSRLRRSASACHLGPDPHALARSSLSLGLEPKLSADHQPPAPSLQPLVSVLRRCRQPVPARVAVTDDRPVRVTTDRRGFAGGTVLQCAGPWRTSGEWWEERAGEVVHTDRNHAEAESLGSRPRQSEDRASAWGWGPTRSKESKPPLLAAKEPRAPEEKWGPTRNKKWHRDEWDVSLGDGAVYRIFRDRDTDGWFIDGVVD